MAIIIHELQGLSDNPDEMWWHCRCGQHETYSRVPENLGDLAPWKFLITQFEGHVIISEESGR